MSPGPRRVTLRVAVCGYAARFPAGARRIVSPHPAGRRVRVHRAVPRRGTADRLPPRCGSPRAGTPRGSPPGHGGSSPPTLRVAACGCIVRFPAGARRIVCPHAAGRRVRVRRAVPRRGTADRLPPRCGSPRAGTPWLVAQFPAPLWVPSHAPPPPASPTTGPSWPFAQFPAPLKGHPHSSPCCAWEVCAKGAGLASAAPHAGHGKAVAPPRGMPGDGASWLGAQFPAPPSGTPTRWGGLRWGYPLLEELGGAGLASAAPHAGHGSSSAPARGMPDDGASWLGAQFPAPLMGAGRSPPGRGRRSGCPGAWARRGRARSSPRPCGRKGCRGMWVRRVLSIGGGGGGGRRCRIRGS